jgi:hypothetical protein
MGEGVFCCHERIEGCGDRVDTVYISPETRRDLDVTIHEVDVTLDTEKPEPTRFTGSSPVSRTGRYILFLAHCDRAAQTAVDSSPAGLRGVAVTAAGRSTWINPYGYLPGHLYGYMPMHGLLTVAYLAVAVGWLLNVLAYRAETIRVHKFFSLLLALCVAESGVCYGDYLWYNNTGFSADAPMYVCVGAKVLQQAFTRACLVALAIGYGVTTPTIAGSKLWLNLLTAAYVLVLGLRDFHARAYGSAAARSPVAVALSLLAAGLEATYFSWVYAALAATIASLRAAGQRLKLTLYLRFAAILGTAAAAVVGFVVYAFVSRVSEFEARHWDRWWFVDVGFWQVLYLCVIAAVAVLWRPSETSKSYAYEELKGQDDIVETDLVEEGRGPHSWAAAGDESEAAELELQQLGMAVSDDEALSDY